MPYFTIGIYHPKTAHNVGTLWRTAYQLGAASIFTIGRRYKKQHSDTYHTPNHIPLFHYSDFEDFKAHQPHGALLVGVEIGGWPLAQYTHPARAVYLLGAEDHGLPEKVLERCQHVVSLQAVNRPSFNVAVTGSIVMYHRLFLDRKE